METVLKDRDAMVALYAPYCEGCERPELLDLALEKLLATRLNGSRRLTPDGSHPFELTWQPGESPQELSQCQLSFPQIREVNYQFSVPTAQLVLWLMKILESAPAAPPPGLPPLHLAAPPLPAPGLGLRTPSLPLPPLPFGAPVLQGGGLAKGAAEAGAPPDLPQSFWCWLLVGHLPPEGSA
jgi:hypothetical protein